MRYLEDDEIEIDVDFIVERLSDKNIHDLLSQLADLGYVAETAIRSNYNSSAWECKHKECCDVLAMKYHSLQNEEVEAIEKIASRFI